MFYIRTLLLLVFVISCKKIPNNNIENKVTLREVKEVKKMKSRVNRSLGTNNIYRELDFNNLVKIRDRGEAIKKYGNPKYTEDFIMDDVQGEFRIELNNFFY